MNEKELLATMALGMIPGIGLISARKLKDCMGTAEAIFAQRKELATLVPGISARIIEALDAPEAFERAKQELEFVQKHNIECLCFDDEAYPSRLRECSDAPLLLFYKGNVPLNQQRVINLVGTRHATEYGRRLCTQFINELKELCPDVLIVSGLAYGIDICAHRAALANGMNTVGVLAHGLDRMYPSQHRETAACMTHQGGLLTEFMSHTSPDRQNFVKRNRIVAGISDATIVVESAAKGGALITAELATDYNRECFAFPGAVGAPYSEGCNNLIRNNGATLLQNAEEFVQAMQWGEAPAKKTVQRELFPDLTDEEQTVVKYLKDSPEGMQINTLTVRTGLAVNKLCSLLFELEMKGVVTPLAGGSYRLLS